MERPLSDVTYSLQDYKDFSLPELQICNSASDVPLSEDEAQG